MDAILIAGPTASGKSSLAMDLAARHGGVVVNADSMQVYDALRILTARPGHDDTAAVEHRLYGHVPADRPYSTGQWLADVAVVLAALRSRGRPAVIVGGTGLYFEALLGGLSAVPTVPEEVREKWRMRLAGEGAGSLHRILAERDQEMAKRLEPADGQRIVRALEVLEVTGRSIATFRNVPGKPLVDPQDTYRILLMPERAELRQRIDRRFDAMMEAGALDEVARLRARGLDPMLPSMKAIGVRELCAYLEGQVALEDTIDRAKAASRQYAKRQTTWFRNRFSDSWCRISHSDDVKGSAVLNLKTTKSP